jgi:hypothetical protein
MRLTSEWRIWGLVGGAAAAQGAVWVLMRVVPGVPHGAGVALQVAILWTAILLLAAVATRRIGWLADRLVQQERAHLAAVDQVGQLALQNALLATLARSVDVGLAFQSLARQVARLVPCDRLGLALLKEDGRTFQTYTARVKEEERRHRPRPDLEFPVDGTVLGRVVQTREPVVVGDVRALAADHVDMNVLAQAGFRSALFVPLEAKNRAVGTLNLVSRAREAFVAEHAEPLRPIAEILAVAVLAQRWQVALTRYRTTEALADVMLSAATEINSALQTIIGQCEVVQREHPEPALQRDLATVMAQAHRVSDLLDRMRRLTQDRLVELAARIDEVRIPTSPEEID